jgi:hypothetical protein
MKANIEKLKKAEKWEYDFIPQQADIDFLIEASNTLAKLEHIKSNPKQILSLLQNCKNAFALMINKSIPTETIELCFEQYIKYLSDCPVYFLSEAFDNIIQTQKFFPSISEILEATDEVKREYFSLRADVNFTTKNFKFKILPRTKDFLKTVLSKPVSEKLEHEITYENSMREKKWEIYQEAMTEFWNERNASKIPT